MRRLALRLLLLAGLSACAAGTARPPRCDRYASPAGRDGAAGTRAQPLRSVQRLADALRPGQTGCLRAGTYAGRGPYVLRAQPGVTLRGLPGERATLTGVVYVPRGADDVTLRDLAVRDTSRSTQISIQIDARRTRLERLDVTNDARKTCIILGSVTGYGVAWDTVIRDSSLHGCGSPADGMLDHAIYVSNARRTRIEGNVIDAAAGYGVQLYPKALGAVVRGNLIRDSGGGIILAGDGRRASAGAVVEDNVIKRSTKDFNLAAYWPGGLVGARNVVRRNCLEPAAGGDIDPDLGSAAVDNADGGSCRLLGAAASAAG